MLSEVRIYKDNCMGITYNSTEDLAYRIVVNKEFTATIFRCEDEDTFLYELVNNKLECKYGTNKKGIPLLREFADRNRNRNFVLIQFIS